MKATEQLIQEHTDVLLMLTVLDSAANKLEMGEQINPLHLEAMIDFLVTFVDKCHHGKEEKLLFPALIKKGMSKEGGPVGVMLAEHTSGREFIKGMSVAVTEYRNGNDCATSDIITNARGYIELLHQHIFKENNILFKMADSKLSETEQKQLLEQFEALENNEFGREKILHYNQMLEELTEIYQ